MEQGFFTISLDFELAWGIYGEKNRNAYQENLLGARYAIPLLLEMFKEYEIHATWATVGFLHFETKNELMECLPEHIPQYACSDLSAYHQLNSVGTDEQSDPLHFASSLVKLIRTYPHQEIGTHTFSHYFCLEKGQNATTFSADLTAAKEASWNKYNEYPKSLVFPRNQINEKYLPLCQQSGIIAFRGNPLYSKSNALQKKLGQLLYEPTSSSDKLVKRFFRLLDGYINLSGNHSYSFNDVISHQSFFNIPASAFLQSYRKSLKILEPMRIHRINSGLTFAAKNNFIYHLWFHPHQFGKNMKENLNCLRLILEQYQKLKEKYHFASLNMGEISNMILSTKKIDHLGPTPFTQSLPPHPDYKVRKNA